jgi:hypothetical protein
LERWGRPKKNARPLLVTLVAEMAVESMETFVLRSLERVRAETGRRDTELREAVDAVTSTWATLPLRLAPLHVCMPRTVPHQAPAIGASGGMERGGAFPCCVGASRHPFSFLFL